MNHTFPFSIKMLEDEPELKQWANYVNMMANRMAMSHYKYGPMREKYPHSATGMVNAKIRMDLYKSTGNIEDLIDAANFLIIEAVFPSHKEAHFRSRTSNETCLRYGGARDATSKGKRAVLPRTKTRSKKLRGAKGD